MKRTSGESARLECSSREGTLRSPAGISLRFSLFTIAAFITVIRLMHVGNCCYETGHGSPDGDRGTLIRNDLQIKGAVSHDISR